MSQNETRIRLAHELRNNHALAQRIFEDVDTLAEVTTEELAEIIKNNINLAKNIAGQLLFQTWISDDLI